MSQTVKAETRIKMIPIYRITKNAAQTDRSFRRQEIAALSKSIEKNGIIQPLTVRDISPYEFELISGERRLRAAVMAGLSEVPCIILHCSKRQSAVYRLVENIQRESLDYFENAEALHRLISEMRFSNEQAASQLCISERLLRDHLSLLSFDREEREIIKSNQFSFNEAAELAKIPDKERRHAALKKAINEELSASEIRLLVKSITEPQKPAAIHKLIVKDLRLFCNTIDRAVSTMRRSGIEAERSKTENDNYIEYKIRIAKNK